MGRSQFFIMMAKAAGDVCEQVFWRPLISLGYVAESGGAGLVTSVGSVRGCQTVPPGTGSCGSARSPPTRNRLNVTALYIYIVNESLVDFTWTLLEFSLLSPSFFNV